MVEQWLNFNIETFHFLRPKVLWLAFPFVFMFVISLIGRGQKVKWKKIIAPHLRPYVILDQKSGYGIWQWLFLMLSVALILIATAGPTWEKKEIPGMKTETVLLIGLDCSLSMLAEDIQPNRLERAKLKVNDLLDANPGARIGLFAFSGTAHPVVPVCSDYKLIKHHINSLGPGIMPVQGTNLGIALNLADSMLKRNNVPGTILLITDAVELSGMQVITDFANRSDHKIELLPISTPDGAKVPSYGRGQFFRDANGEFVISKPDVGVLNQLNQHENIRLHNLTLDNSDVTFLADEIRENLDIQLGDTLSDDDWEDMGWWLLLPVAFFILLWFRRGWVIQFVVILMLGWQACSPDSKNAQLWYTDNYIAQYYQEADSFNQAAEKFESLSHKAVAYYKAENYDAALSLFALDSSANGQYNRSITLARMGRYEESIEAMNQAIELDPTLPEAEKLIQDFEKNKWVQDSVNRQYGNKKELNETEGKKEELQTRRAKGKDEELNDETEVDEMPDEGKRVAEEVETDIIQAEEMDKPMENQEMAMNKVDAQNIMLRKISSDPGEFLRRRFKMQKEKYYPDIKETEIKW